MRPDGQHYGERELGLMIEVQRLEERKSGNGFLEAGLACRPRGSWGIQQQHTFVPCQAWCCAQNYSSEQDIYSLLLVHLEPGAYGEREQNDYKHEKGFKGSSFI